MADKGGNVVVMKMWGNSLEMCLAILSHDTWYCKISEEIIKEYNKEFDEMIDSAFVDGIVDKTTLEAINFPYARTSSFYALPKIHKNLTRQPSRPIISGIGAKTEKGSLLVDAWQ